MCLFVSILDIAVYIVVNFIFQPARKERSEETVPRCVRVIVKMAAILWPENATMGVNRAGTLMNVIPVS